MNEKKGYIKLYRQVQDSQIWVDPFKLKLWMLCLFKAQHEQQKEVLLGNQIVHLMRGQFITGRKSLEEEYNRCTTSEHQISGISLYRWLELFEKLKMLNIKKTNKYSIITILNWDTYQVNEQQMNNKVTSNEHQMNTKKNDKECNKNDKEEKKKVYKKENFKKPTLEELTSFIRENNFSVDASYFLDYYNSNGWKVGKGSMKDWKATVRNWDRREKKNGSSKPKSFADMLKEYD